MRLFAQRYENERKKVDSYTLIVLQAYSKVKTKIKTK